jgi:ribosomal protein S18 acetylase RimI-like enzyme
MTKKETSGSLEGLEIGALDASEVGEAVEVTARGMRDNPLHVAVYGEDPELRLRKLRRMFGAAAEVLNLRQHLLVARAPDGAIVGVCGTMPPGGCQPSIGQQLRLMPQLLANGPRATLRTARWLGAWAKQDPKTRHCHLGPVAVDTHLQGMGIGSRLMKAHCAQVDAAGEDAYLETDKLANVRFYERFGFEVVGEQEILGVPNWFMLRQAR